MRAVGRHAELAGALPDRKLFREREGLTLNIEDDDGVVALGDGEQLVFLRRRVNVRRGKAQARKAGEHHHERNVVTHPGTPISGYFIRKRGLVKCPWTMICRYR